MSEPVTLVADPLVRDPRRAFVAAVAVAVVLLLGFFVNYLENWVLSAQGGVFLLGVVLPALLAGILPKAAGVFLVLWGWPHRTEERILLVLVRALAAALAGVVLAGVVSFSYAMIVSGLRVVDAGELTYRPFAGLFSETVQLAPVVMLVALVQWGLARGARL